MRVATWLCLALVLGPGCPREPAPPVGEQIGVEVTEPTAPDVEIASPDGAFAAAVFSIGEPGWGNTQVSLTHLSTGRGSGVVSFELYGVPLRLEWLDGETLRILHPAEIQPAHRETEIPFAPAAAMDDLSRATAGLGKAPTPAEVDEVMARLRRLPTRPKRTVRIEFQPYGGAADVIATLRQEAASAVPHQPPANLLPEGRRGTLVAVDDRFVYSYYEAHEPDSIAAQLQRKGYQGGGESWAGIIYGLVQSNEPGLLGALRFDPEGDGLAISSSDAAALTRVAGWVTEAHRDPAILRRAIARAEADDQME